MKNNYTSVKTFFVFFLILFSKMLFAQPMTSDTLWLWAQGGNGDDFVNCVVQSTTDSNYVFAGTTGSVNGDVPLPALGGRDAWMYKVDKNTGLIIAQGRYGGNNGDQVFTLTQTSDGGFIGCGWSQTIAIPGYHGNTANGDIYVVKVDANMQMQWHKCYGGTNAEFGGMVIQASNGNYIIAGRSNSNDGDVKGGHGGNDIWVAEINANGNHDTIWQRMCGGTGVDDMVNVLFQTSDGGFVLGGRTNSPNNNDLTGAGGFLGYDAWAFKINPVNPRGPLAWSKKFGGDGDESFRAGFIDALDGNYVFAGTSGSVNGNLATANPAPNGSGDYWILKINSLNQSLIWNRCFGGSKSDFLISAAPCSDGGYVMCGRSFSYDGDVLLNHPGSSTAIDSADCWMAKINPIAPMLDWQKCIGGTKYDGANWIKQTYDGGYIVAGEGNSDDGDIHGAYSPHPPEDSFIFKLVPDAILSSQHAAEIKNNFASSFVYPNPFSESATIKIITQQKIENAELKIYDILGNEVMTIANINSSEIKIERENLTTGIYFYQLTNNGKIIYTGKLVAR